MMRTIGIVGAGRIGRTLAARFTTAGHDLVLSRLSAARSISKLLFGCVAVFGAVGCAMSAQTAPPQAHPLRDAADWREWMQKNHSAERSIEQQVRRLTRDLELTPEQQEKVRQLSKEHNDKIQKILDTAPPSLTYEDFTTQVHAISQEFHDAVNAILTPHERELMQAMVGRLNSGKENRHAP
jgi:3-hydroxyacyl-CoA dehydrogenase